MEELHDRSSIGPRSWRDRAAIGELQRWNRLQTTGRRPTIDQDDDYGPIAARSWPDRGPIVLEFVAFSKRNSSSFPTDLKPQSHAIETASTTLENRPHERVNCPRSSGPISSLKSDVVLHCSLTFDRLVKKLSEFRGRS